MFVAVHILSCASWAASTAIVIWFASSLLLSGLIFGLAVAASTVDTVAMILFFALNIFFLRHYPRGVTFTAGILSISLWCAGSVLSLLTLGFVVFSANTQKLETDVSILAIAGFIVSLAGLIPQSVFFFFFWRQQKGRNVSAAEVHDQRRSTSRPMKRSLSVHLPACEQISPALLESASQLPSPSNSCFATTPRSSFTHSAHRPTRPTASGTHLPIAQSFTAQGHQISAPMREISKVKTGHYDFENRKPAAMKAPQGSVSTPSLQQARRALETIPGSAPTSPGRKLDGPFAESAGHERTSSQKSSRMLPLTSPSSVTNFSTRLPPLTVPMAADTDESHIHPLFRTRSPSLPPVKSPRTIITASPYAGQIVSPEQIFPPGWVYSAHDSRSGSPTVQSPIHPPGRSALQLL